MKYKTRLRLSESAEESKQGDGRNQHGNKNRYVEPVVDN